MRVALVCPYAWRRYGGVQSHVAALARVLAGRGHEVAVIAPGGQGPGGADAGAVPVLEVGRALAVPANGSMAPLAFGPRAAAGVRRALQRIRPEVVHLHEPLIPSLSLLALWQGAAPAIGTFHAAAEASAGYRLAGPALRRAARRLAVRTAVSDAARDLVARYFPGDYVLTPNGVEVERFARAAPAELPTSVLFLGRIERRKGLEVLIQAMTRLKDLACELIVAGSGPEEGRCRRLAAQLGVPARFVGAVDEATKASLLRGATVYCAPGLGGESFGIVLAEAMAAGAPVVCSDLLGFRAVAGAAALLVPPGQAGPLADALRLLLSDEGERAARARASRRVAQAYDWSRLVAGVEACYQRALEGAA